MTDSAGTGNGSSRPAGTQATETAGQPDHSASGATPDPGPGYVAGPADEPPSDQEHPGDDRWEPL